MVGPNAFVDQWPTQPEFCVGTIPTLQCPHDAVLTLTLNISPWMKAYKNPSPACGLTLREIREFGYSGPWLQRTRIPGGGCRSLSALWLMYMESDLLVFEVLFVSV